MATFTGTTNPDNFVGLDGVADTFRFTPLTLSGGDTAKGGNGAINDTLELTGPGRLTASQMAGVSQIEILRLLVGEIVLQVTNLMATTTRSNNLAIVGSSGNDTVSTVAVTDVTRKVSFTAGDGDDIYIGGIGLDSVSIRHDQLTANDVLIGGTGSARDGLTISSAGELASDAFANVVGFEVINLAAGGNAITLGQETIGSSSGGSLRVIGGSGADSLTVSGSARIVASLGDGDNFFHNGGTGQSEVTGGADDDNFYGGTTKDRLFGMGGGDYLQASSGSKGSYLDGGADVDTLYSNDTDTTMIGGAGADFIYGGFGRQIIEGGADEDTIFLIGDGKADVVRYVAQTDGGAGRDTIQSLSGGPLGDGDLKIQLAKAAFATLGGNLDKVVLDNGSGNVDGADLVLYDDGGAGLIDASSVNAHLYNHYFADATAGTLVLNNNNNGSATLYYDTGSFFAGRPAVVLATIFNLADFSAFANNFELY